MKKNLPPPHWSPTGNGGEWRWGEEKIGKQERGCWHWHDDVYGKMKSEDVTKLKLQEVTARITAAKGAGVRTKKQSFLKKWWQKLFK